MAALCAAGTLAYLGGEMFKSAAGINIVHISYKGTVLALNDLVGGQVQLMFSDMPIALPHAGTVYRIHQVRGGPVRQAAQRCWCEGRLN